MTAPKLFFKQFVGNNFFYESGSCMGDGIQNALDSGIRYVYSVELSEYYHAFCQGRFYCNGNVKLYLGDTVKLMPGIIAGSKEAITFWLDGHDSGGKTAKGDGYKIDGFPVFEELAIIAAHPVKTHTILIDDISPTPEQFRWTKEIEALIKKINPAYTIRYERGAQPEGYILIAEAR